MKHVVAYCLLPVALCLPSFAPAPVHSAAVPQRGLSAVAEVTAAYDAVLNAEFERLAQALDRTCPPAPPVACLTLRALGTWWEVLLDPRSRLLDPRFVREVEAAIDGAAAWTAREPERAEAWFYLGAALGARSQWRVLREERLAAARDGKRIKAALERALAIDPGLHDAEFGIGVYRYYADVAPAYLRWLRWLFLLPGGDRRAGLAQMEQASRAGQVIRAEAQYQLHLAYLWYENRAPEALALVAGLRDRYPRNPLFRQLEAEILDVYLHDAAGSLAGSLALLDDAEHGEVNRAELAMVRARLNIAVQLDRMGQRDRARETLDTLLAGDPIAPLDAVTRARGLQRAWARR